LFTGIIEEIGTVKDIFSGTKSIKITFELPKKFDDVKVGDSIAVNGVCLTVSHLTESEWTADVMPETMRKSSLGELKAGSKVNMERAMPATGRFGGHIVSGHIDGMGTIISRRADDIAVWFEVAADFEILKYTVLKGSITIDGISLTVASVSNASFKVSVIPHTLKQTILEDKYTGSKVNLEADIIAKYIEKISGIGKETGISERFLEEKGFI